MSDVSPLRWLLHTQARTHERTAGAVESTALPISGFLARHMVSSARRCLFFFPFFFLGLVEFESLLHLRAFGHHHV